MGKLFINLFIIIIIFCVCIQSYMKEGNVLFNDTLNISFIYECI